MLERAELERAAAKFRQLATELLHSAPAVAMKAGALACECELRAKKVIE